MNTNNAPSLKSTQESSVENDEIDSQSNNGNGERKGISHTNNGIEAPPAKKARIEPTSPVNDETLSHKLPPPPPPTPASPCTNQQHLQASPHESIYAPLTQQREQSMTFSSLDVREDQDNLSVLSSANSSPSFSGENPYRNTSEKKVPTSISSSAASSISSSASFTVPPVPPSTPVSTYSSTSAASGSASARLASAATTPHSSLHVPSLASNTSDHMNSGIGMGTIVGQQASFQSMATPVPRRQEGPQPETAYATTRSYPAASTSSTSTSYGSFDQQNKRSNGSEIRRRGVKRGTPKYSSTSKPSTQHNSSSDKSAPDDFKDWNVGPKYELMRILGRGSYGVVAQARVVPPNIDGNKQGHPPTSPNFVAIKRISKAFELEVDALRLFREMYILRKLKGHECIIQLVDIIPPESCNIDDFNDLYLVFDCKLYMLCICFIFLFYNTYFLYPKLSF